jgi:hypothetical protein
VSSKRRFRRSRTFIAWSGRLWSVSILFVPPITTGIGGSARIGWVGITMARFEYFAIRMPGRVRVDCKRTAHRKTGAALL